jgi:dsRNA-specific ribonuclease
MRSAGVMRRATGSPPSYRTSRTAAGYVACVHDARGGLVGTGEGDSRERAEEAAARDALGFY